MRHPLVCVSIFTWTAMIWLVSSCGPKQSGTDTVGATPIPETPVEAAAVEPVKVAVEEPVGEPAWGPLRWGMSAKQVQLALEAEGIPFEAKRNGKRSNFYMIMHPKGFEKGVIYFGKQSETIQQIDLHGEQTKTDGPVTDLLSSLEKDHGRPTDLEYMREQVWRNDSIILWVTLCESDDQWQVTEEWTKNDTWKTGSSRSAFADKTGPSGLNLGMSVQKAQMALSRAGLPTGEVKMALVLENTLNAPPNWLQIKIDRKLRFTHKQRKWTLEFNDNSGLRKINIESPLGSRLRGDAVIRGIVKKYGKTKERYDQTTYHWEADGLKMFVAAYFHEQDGTWSYIHNYSQPL